MELSYWNTSDDVTILTTEERKALSQTFGGLSSADKAYVLSVWKEKEEEEKALQEFDFFEDGWMTDYMRAQECARWAEQMEQINAVAKATADEFRKMVEAYVTTAEDAEKADDEKEAIKEITAKATAAGKTFEEVDPRTVGVIVNRRKTTRGWYKQKADHKTVQELKTQLDGKAWNERQKLFAQIREAKSVVSSAHADYILKVREFLDSYDTLPEFEKSIVASPERIRDTLQAANTIHGYLHGTDFTR